MGFRHGLDSTGRQMMQRLLEMTSTYYKGPGPGPCELIRILANLFLGNM